MKSDLFLAVLAALLGNVLSQLSRAVNYHIFDGSLEAEGVSLGACLSMCSDEPSCLAIDYNFPTRGCWFHTSATVCNTRYSKSSCVHYSFVECPLANPGIAVGVVKLEGMHLFNGVRQVGISTLESCLQQCALTGVCEGLDFDTNPHPVTGELRPECWLHDSQSECTTPGNKESCTHYSFVDCATRDTQTTLTPPVTTYDDTDHVPPIGNFERIQGSCVKHGSLQREAMSEEECLALCWENPHCQGFDFNQGSMQCFIHYEDTECNALLARPTCSHYRVRANCVAQSLLNCVTIGYTVTSNAGRDGGEVVAMASTLEDCQAMCTAQYDCVGAKVNEVTGYCTLYNTTGPTQYRDDCTYATKFCSDEATTHSQGTPAPPHSYTTTPLPNTATTMATTTAANFFQNPTTIPDGGLCPDSFAKYPASNMAGGSRDSSVNSEEGCKRACLTQGMACAAADWNRDTSECFLHATLDLTAFRPGQLCCIHYRRINCEDRFCYNHGEEDVTALLFNFFSGTPGLALDDVTGRLNILTSVWEPPTIQCPGSCYTSITFQPSTPGSTEPNIIDTSVPLLIERGCNIAPSHRQKNCIRQNVDADNDYQKMTCNCYGDKCNAFGLLLNDCAGYYPLDANADDLSFSLRDGVEVKLQYDAFHMQKNWSAIFSGESRVKIPGYSNFLWGNVNSQTGNKSPAFTVTMWVNRLGTSNTMYLFSNGDSYNIYSEPDGTNQNHIIRWKISIAGVEYSAQTDPVPMNQWLWLAFVVSDNRDNYHMTIYVDDTADPVVDVDTGLAVDLSGPGYAMDTQARPLCLGDISVDSNQLNQITESVSPFIGYLDEVWLFTKAVTDLSVVKQVSTGDQ